MSILRVPRLCREFHKAIKKQIDNEENNRAEKEAYWLLKQFIGEESEQRAMSNFMHEFDSKYA